MISKYLPLSSIIIIVSLGCIVGAGTVYTTQLYSLLNQQAVHDQIRHHHKRILKIEYVNQESNLIGATTVDLDILGVRNIMFSVDTNTLVQRRNPIIENGVVTAFSAKEDISVSDLEVGSEIFAWLVVLEDGRFYANALITGTPFVRP